MEQKPAEFLSQELRRMAEAGQIEPAFAKTVADEYEQADLNLARAVIWQIRKDQGLDET